MLAILDHPGIEKRQLKFLGHVIRKGWLEDLVLCGRNLETRARDTQRFTFITNKAYVKILDIFGRLHVIEHNGKTS